MKITRNQFLKLIPAAALTLTGCGSKTQPANTESLVFSHHYKLDYAQQFTADCYEGGYTMLTIAESDARFLVVPEDAAEGEIVQNISQEAEDLHAEIWNQFKNACN